MIRMRSLARFPALAISALALSLGAAPAFAASAAPSHPARPAVVPAGVTFHPLTLLNGWVSSQHQFGTGSPRAARSNGVVYLAGSLHEQSGSNDHFANLPPADRPSHYLYLPIYTDGYGEGSLEIAPSGHMYLFGNGNTTGYSSLAGISFPVALASQALAPQNGWQSAQPSYQTGDPMVAVSNGVAYLSGSLEQPSGTSDTFATLPPADWPSHWLYFPVYTDNGGEGSLEVSPTGALSVWGTGATQYSSLAGISFPLTLASQKLHLSHGWQSAQSSWDTSDPRAAVHGGVVYLSGSAWLPSGTAVTLAGLPRADRPSHWLYLPVYTYGGTEGSLVISPSGTVSAYGAAAHSYTSLAGLHFPAGS